ncbi:MAG: hypothetical protein ABL898_19795 [Hyphomicrobiaceae bacterium]
MSAIALDTNLLLLLVVGQATGAAVGKRLKSFSDDDYQLLLEFVSNYDRLIITPNVATEVSNIWDFGLGGDWRRQVPVVLAHVIQQSLEISKPSKDVVEDPEFARLGLADCAWLGVLDQETTLLTDDVALWNVASSRGFRAVNFTSLRNFD